MTNDILKSLIAESVADEEELNDILVLEGDEFANGAIGLSTDNRIIYSYNKLVESLMIHNNWSEEEAIDWLDYNTLGSLDYMESQGKAPIIMITEF